MNRESSDGIETRNLRTHETACNCVFVVDEFVWIVPMMMKQILSFYLYAECNEESYLET